MVTLVGGENDPHNSGLFAEDAYLLYESADRTGFGDI
jgi:hypothetical protein